MSYLVKPVIPQRKSFQIAAGAKVLTSEDSLRLLEEKALKKQKEQEEKEQRKKDRVLKQWKKAEDMQWKAESRQRKKREREEEKKQCEEQKKQHNKCKSSLRKQGSRVSESNVSMCRRWKLLTEMLQLVWTILKKQALRFNPEIKEQE